MIKCFSVVSMVVDEATQQFSPMYKLNQEWLDILKQYCEVIDKLSVQCEGVAYDVGVDDLTHEVSISMECPSFYAEPANKHFLEVLKSTVTLRFDNCGNGNVKATFVFPTLWE